MADMYESGNMLSCFVILQNFLCHRQALTFCLKTISQKAKSPR